MKGKTLVFLACTILVQITHVITAGYYEYTKEKCPICYNPKRNIPAECTRDEADLNRTKACDEDEMCVFWKVPDVIPDDIKESNYHKITDGNAMYFCGTAREMGNFKNLRKGEPRDVEHTTAIPTAASSSPTRTNAPNDFTMSKGQAGRTADTNASTDKTSDKPTTVSADEDEPACEPGTMINRGECAPCPLNKYSDAANSNECTPCSGGKVTVGTRSTSADDCFACGPGQMLRNNGESCKDCPANKYSQKVHNTRCLLCPDGRHTDGQLGSTSVYDCVEKKCTAGNRYVADGRYCDRCDENTFMAEASHNHTECEPCPTGTTSNTGSSSKDQCKGPEDETTSPDDGTDGSKVLESSFLLLSLMSILVFRF